MAIRKPISVPKLTAAANGSQNGVRLVNSGSPLTRLNDFDGKFLRAADMQLEQGYLRTLVELSNRAGGPGVAYGFSVSLQGDNQFLLGPGLAMDGSGQVLLLPASQAVALADLIGAAKAAQSGASGTTAAFGDCAAPAAGSGDTLTTPSDLFLLTICHAEALCGEEDVYGKLCEEACVTSTDRPYRVEGIVVRLAPLSLKTLLPQSSAVTLGPEHLRSRVATAYFEDERKSIADLVSKAGLASEVWCQGAFPGAEGCVALGVVGVAGSAVSFFDAWTARRERMDPPAKRYWQWRMRMRPWDVFVAQILQFQCQLRDGLQAAPGGVTDPCKNTRQLVGEAANVIAELHRYYASVSEKLTAARFDTAGATVSIPGGAAYIGDLMTRLSLVRKASAMRLLDRLLIRQGFVTIPSAGILPVAPGSAMTINDQVRQWMGEGVDLRFCVVTPDYVQHAIEEAQHMERISLVQGLDDPANKPDVDILVPNGQMLARQLTGAGMFAASLHFTSDILTPLVNKNNFPPFVFAQVQTPNAVDISGAARVETLPSGGGVFYMGGQSPAPSSSSSVTGASTGPPPVNAQFWAALRCDRNPLTLNAGETTPVSMRLALAGKVKQQAVFDFQLRGEFRADTEETIALPNNAGVARTVSGRLSALASLDTRLFDAPAPTQQAGSLVLNATYAVAPSGGGQIAEVGLSQEQNAFNFLFAAKWTDADPLDVQIEIGDTITASTGNKVTTKSVATGELLKSAAVAGAQNQFHQGAVSGVQTLAAILSDAGFAVEALRELFPPPAASGDTADVIGTLDWVAFQRRRVKNCGEEQVAATTTRRYRVYVASSSPQLSNRLVDVGIVYREVGFADFAADSATLLTPVSTLLSQWQAAKPGNLILVGGIYGLGDAAMDGDALALGRLRALETAVAKVSATSPSVSNTVVATPPASTSTADVDGVMVLITVTSSSSSSSSKRLLERAVRKLILRNYQSPGDIVMLTAAVRDLHRTYPGRFATDVRTPCPELWLHNPFLTPLEEGDPEVEIIDCQYPLVHESNDAPWHFLHGFIDFLSRKLELEIRPAAFRGDIHLSGEEKDPARLPALLALGGRPYWIVVAGGKTDFTIKWWSRERYQEVVDAFRGRLLFVQTGNAAHPRLDGVIDLRGRTSLRELVRLVYHAAGVLTPVSLTMHLAAAVDYPAGEASARPCVVVAGGREPPSWEAYPAHQFLHTVGALPCCGAGGCWRSRTAPLGDGAEQDAPDQLCVDVAGGLPRCMDMIRPRHVVDRIEWYLEGAARRPKPRVPAVVAAEEFIETLALYAGGCAGRGIVICAGGALFTSAWVAIRRLRAAGCGLPVELWHLGQGEMDGRMKGLLDPLDVRPVDAYEQLHDTGHLGGWELKPLALLHCAFEQALLLDADNLCYRDPEPLFDTPDFRSTGALFWPDVGRLEERDAAWDIFGVPYRDEPAFETGQVALDKARCWKPLSLTAWYNRHSDYFYRFVYGDKDTFHMAFRKLEHVYAMPPRGCEKRDLVFTQFDFAGAPLFQHGIKWSLSGDNREYAGFDFFEECRAYVEELRALWDGKVRVGRILPVFRPAWT